MIARLIPLVGALLLFPITAVLDRVTPPPPNVVETLPPPSVLPILASGHRLTLADLLEIRAVTFALGTMDPGVSFTDEDRDHLFQLYEGILALDPDNVDAAIRGSVLISAFGWRADASATLLQIPRGRTYTFQGRERCQRPANPANPRFWRLFYEEAGIYLSMRANQVQSPAERLAWIRKAGELWIAAEEAGANPGYGLRAAGERLARSGLSQEDLLQREFDLWKERIETAPKEIRADVERHLNALAALIVTYSLQRKLQPLIDALVQRGRDVPDLRAFGPRLGLDPAALEPPCGGSYRVVDGRVVCAEAEAILLERSLNQSLTSYRQAQPGGRPTLADVGWLVPPLAPPLTHNPLFRFMGWYPVAVEIGDLAPTQPGWATEARATERVFFWDLYPSEPPTPSSLGLRPVTYLTYWIEDDAVRVVPR